MRAGGGAEVNENHSAFLLHSMAAKLIPGQANLPGGNNLGNLFYQGQPVMPNNNLMGMMNGNQGHLEVKDGALTAPEKMSREDALGFYHTGARTPFMAMYAEQSNQNAVDLVRSYLGQMLDVKKGGQPGAMRSLQTTGGYDLKSVAPGAITDDVIAIVSQVRTPQFIMFAVKFLIYKLTMNEAPGTSGDALRLLEIAADSRLALNLILGGFHYLTELGAESIGNLLAEMDRIDTSGRKSKITIANFFGFVGSLNRDDVNADNLSAGFRKVFFPTLDAITVPKDHVHRLANGQAYATTGIAHQVVDTTMKQIAGPAATTMHNSDVSLFGATRLYSPTSATNLTRDPLRSSVLTCVAIPHPVETGIVHVRSFGGQEFRFGTTATPKNAVTVRECINNGGGSVAEYRDLVASIVEPGGTFDDSIRNALWAVVGPAMGTNDFSGATNAGQISTALLGANVTGPLCAGLKDYPALRPFKVYTVFVGKLRGQGMYASPKGGVGTLHVADTVPDMKPEGDLVRIESKHKYGFFECKPGVNPQVVYIPCASVDDTSGMTRSTVIVALHDNEIQHGIANIYQGLVTRRADTLKYQRVVANPPTNVSANFAPMPSMTGIDELYLQERDRAGKEGGMPDPDGTQWDSVEKRFRTPGTGGTIGPFKTPAFAPTESIGFGFSDLHQSGPGSLAHDVPTMLPYVAIGSYMEVAVTGGKTREVRSLQDPTGDLFTKEKEMEHSGALRPYRAPVKVVL